MLSYRGYLPFQLINRAMRERMVKERLECSYPRLIVRTNPECLRITCRCHMTLLFPQLAQRGADPSLVVSRLPRCGGERQRIPSKGTRHSQEPEEGGSEQSSSSATRWLRHLSKQCSRATSKPRVERISTVSRCPSSNAGLTKPSSSPTATPQCPMT